MTKRRAGVKLVIWLPTTKRRESTFSQHPIWECDMALERSRRGLQLWFRPRHDRTLQSGVMSSQSHGTPTWTISGLQFGSPEKKSHLDVASTESCRVYCKEEGGTFPQVRAVVSLVCPCCPWLVLTPRVLQLCTNHFVWIVCRPVWVNEACQLFLVPSQSSNTPLYPSKWYELGNVPRLLLLPLFPTWAHIWVLWRVKGASKSLAEEEINAFDLS
jgi:hypothetical protein